MPRIEPNEAIAIALSVATGAHHTPHGRAVMLVCQALEQSGWEFTPRPEPRLPPPPQAPRRANEFL